MTLAVVFALSPAWLIACGLIGWMPWSFVGLAELPSCFYALLSVLIATEDGAA